MLIGLDMCLLFFMLFIAIRDTKRGFLTSFGASSRLIFTLLLAFALVGLVSELIDRFIIYDRVHQLLQDTLRHHAENAKTKAPLWLLLLAFLGGVDTEALQASSDHTAASLARPLSHGLSSVLAFVILFFVLRIFLRFFLPFLAALLHKISLFRVLDTVLGLVFGVIHALFLGYIAAAVLGAFISVFTTASVKDAPLVAFLNNISPLRLIASIWY